MSCLAHDHDHDHEHDCTDDCKCIGRVSLQCHVSIATVQSYNAMTLYLKILNNVHVYR